MPNFFITWKKWSTCGDTCRSRKKVTVSEKLTVANLQFRELGLYTK